MVNVPTTPELLERVVHRLPLRAATLTTLAPFIPNIEPGDPVILREDKTAPLHWPTAVITDVHPGADGRIRVVTVKTPKGTFKRPIAKICPLLHVKNEL